MISNEDKRTKYASNGVVGFDAARDTVPKKWRVLSLVLMIICAVLLVALIILIVLFVQEQNTPGKQDPFVGPDTTSGVTPTMEDTTVKQDDFDSRLTSSVEKGKLWLLSQRNADWGWGTRFEAEAIIPLQLIDNLWYDPAKAETEVSVKQMKLDLLAALSRYKDLDVPDWYGGKLAQYINGLVATCNNPKDFYGHDLITLLQQQMDGYPKYYFNHLFSYSWAVLALCNSGEQVNASYIQTLTATAGIQYPFGLDEAAMTVMAMACIRNQSDVEGPLAAAIEYILNGTKTDGSFGNEFTTGLVVQAFYAAKQISDNKILRRATERLLDAQGTDGSFKKLLAANHVLPALAKQSWADIRKTSYLCFPGTTTTPSPNTAAPSVNIKITIEDFISPQNINETFSVAIPQNVSLFDALQTLDSSNDNFNFTSKSTSWGMSIKSILGVYASPSDKTYWQILVAPDSALTTSVDSHYPQPNEHDIFRFTSY